MNIKKLVFLIPILAALSFSFFSCSKKESPSCRELLGRILENEVALPAGRIYSLSSKEGESEFIPDDLICSLYGGGKSPVVRNGWIDGSIFLPLGEHPCEFAILKCDTHDTAVDTARILCLRLDTIKSLKSEEKYPEHFSGAGVRIIGNYVFLVISSDSERTFKAINGYL